VLQTQQTESEQTGAAIVTRGKACEFGGRIGLTTREGADEQTGEVATLLDIRGSIRDGEERRKQIAETETVSGCKPSAGTCFCSEAVADDDRKLPAESESTDRDETVEEMTEGAGLIAASAVQLSEFFVFFELFSGNVSSTKRSDESKPDTKLSPPHRWSAMQTG